MMSSVENSAFSLKKVGIETNNGLLLFQNEGKIYLETAIAVSLKKESSAWVRKQELVLRTLKAHYLEEEVEFGMETKLGRSVSEE
jgi:hypothetical protein